MLNPFYWYSVIWTIILISYQFYLSNILIKLSITTILFLMITIIFSFLIGYKLKEKYKFKKLDNLQSNHSFKIVLLIVLLNSIEFIYCKQIPLFSVILGKARYAEYTGIPTIHVIIVTFTMFYAIYMAYLYLAVKQKRYMINFGILLGILVLLLSRSLIFIVLMAVIVMYFSTIKFNNKNIIIFSILIILGMWAFSILGNLRSGVAWNDYSFINTVGEIKENGWFPNVFNWIYLYITTPLANLEFNIQQVEPLYNLKQGIFNNFIPDFISKRIISETTEVLLINPAFTVSTAFAQIHNSFGLIGMYLLFGFYSLINISYIYIVNEENRFYTLGISCLTTMMMLTFFVNSYMYSGWSFILVFPIIYVIYSELDKRYQINNFIFQRFKRLKYRKLDKDE